MNIQSIDQDKSFVASGMSTSVTTNSDKVFSTCSSGIMPVVSGPASSEKSPENSMQDQERTKDLIARIQEKIDQLGINLEFCTYGEHDERISIIVKEKASGKIIREIPPEVTQKLYEKMNELTGILFNEEV